MARGKPSLREVENSALGSLVAPGGKSFLLAHKAAVCVAVFYYQRSSAAWEKQAQAGVLGVGMGEGFMHQTPGKILQTLLQVPLSQEPGAALTASPPEGMSSLWFGARSEPQERGLDHRHR